MLGAELVVEGYGLAFAVLAAGVTEDELAAWIPPGFSIVEDAGQAVCRRYALVDRSPGRIDVFAADELAAVATAPQEALSLLKNDIERYTTEYAPASVFVHSGVVAVDGRAVLLPGTSGAGKTSAVTALVQAGATYLSDEFAVLDNDGLVHPYARPLQVVVHGETHKRLVDPAVLGAVASGPRPVGAIVLTTYGGPGARWDPVAVSPGQAVLRMLEHTVPIRRDPERVLRVLGRVCESVVVVESPRGDAAEFAGLLLGFSRDEGPETGS